MKNYITPTMEIKRFAAENVVTTGSTAAIDKWKNDLGENQVATVNWNSDKLKTVTFIF